VRNEVAEELLGLRPMNDRRVLARRAALLGLGVDSALQVAVLRVGANGAPREARFQHAARILGLVEERLTAGDVPFVLTHREDDVLVVAPQPLDETLRAPLHELSEASVLVHTGVGRAVPTLDSLPRSLLDARFAVEQLRVDPAHHDRAERILSHADLDLATALVCDADPAVAEPRRAALLDRVIANELRETLLAYLDHQLDISRTAAYLHLHPNSLRYRLGRIEEQLGRSLRDPGTIANLHLAVILERATRRADNGDT
jgi:purine catabolism regulator